jgi:hypothetical protein
METVEFNNFGIGTFHVPVFQDSGITITGSADLTIFNEFDGELGVSGGLQDNSIDGNEFIFVSFDRGIATDVSYDVFSAFEIGESVNGIIAEASIIAFDINGFSLGLHRVSGRGTQNISALFGNQPISAFQVRANLDRSGFSIESITFNPGLDAVTVNTLDDEIDRDINFDDLSLREAIFSVRDGGTIRFSPTLSGGIINLALGELAIDKNITIEGLGENNLTISGSNESRIFRIDGNTEVNINGLTIAD